MDWANSKIYQDIEQGRKPNEIDEKLSKPSLEDDIFTEAEC